MKNVAELCSATFDGPFAWFDLNGRSNSERMYLQELQRRKFQLVDKGQKHSMIVAVAEDDKIVGIGLHHMILGRNDACI